MMHKIHRFDVVKSQVLCIEREPRQYVEFGVAINGSDMNNNQINITDPVRIALSTILKP